MKYDNQEWYLAPLLYKASVHTNTSGVFKGFYKRKGIDIGQFGGENKNCLERIMSPIVLPYPIFSNFECDVKIHNMDINDLILSIKDLDLVYYDPPYNQHPYGSNYFMLNVIADYIEPEELSKNSGIPKNWNKSGYNKSEESYKLLEDLFKNTESKYILTSYSDEGLVSIDDIEIIAKKYGKLEKVEIPYVRFRGGRKIESNKNTLKEYIFILEK